MWIWRRMDRISWGTKISNKEVLAKVEEDRQIIKETSLDLAYFET